MQKQKSKTWASAAITLIMFVCVLGVVLIATNNLSSGASNEGLNTTKQAIERAAVLCYASEGFYPPGLSYIKENYGVQVDTEKYSVRYEVFASNVMPDVNVNLRKTLDK